MSRKKIPIERLPYYEVLRGVTLNRNGPQIGAIVRWIGKTPAYLSWRTGEHYFIKHQGFGIDRALMYRLIQEDKIDLIIIDYKGPRGKRWFVSSVDDWVLHSVEVQHAKEVDGNTYETYGVQKVLNEKYMDEYELHGRLENWDEVNARRE